MPSSLPSVPIQEPEPNLDSMLRVIRQLKEAVQRLQKRVEELERR